MGRILGSQTPTFQNFKEESFPYEELVLSEKEITNILHIFGIVLLKWQMNILKKLLIGNKNSEESKLLLSTLALLVPRQNGKSQILIAYIIISMLMGRSGIYSSFLFSSAKDIFFRVQNHISSNPHMHKKFWFSSEEAKTPTIKYMGLNKDIPPYFVFVTRGGNFGRGLTDLDTIIYDEAQHIKESQIAGVEATISTSSAPQQIFMGTPALPLVDKKTGKPAADNDYFHVLKKSIIEEKSMKKVWVEWSSPQIFEKGNEKIIAKYNPSYNHDLGKGKRIGASAFESNATNLNFSIERLGYQIQSSIYGEAQLLSSEIIESVCLSSEKLEEKYYKKGKYVLSIKSTLNNEKVYLVKTMRSKDNKNYFTALVDILYMKDNSNVEKLADLLLKELKTLQCSKIVIDGNIRNNIKNSLSQAKKWSSTKNQSEQGKILIAPVSTIVESSAVFTEKFNAGSVHFSENIKSTLEDLIPSIRRRQIREGYGFISSTMDAELVDCFALGVLEASKNL